LHFGVSCRPCAAAATSAAVLPSTPNA
jgi:hypothetical protein